MRKHSPVDPQDLHELAMAEQGAEDRLEDGASSSSMVHSVNR